MDIHAVMQSLSHKRSIFHLESDFQFALAWEIKLLNPECEIRLEVPFNHEKKGQIDIIVRTKDGVYPIELKYLKKALTITVDDEQFSLADGVHDLDMYSCISDIARIEYYVGLLPGFCKGYAIWLTNDPAFWTPEYNASYYKAFHVPDGAVKTGRMSHEAINKRTGKPPQILSEPKYKSPITLEGRHLVKWCNYSDLGVAKGVFKYSVIEISGFL